MARELSEGKADSLWQKFSLLHSALLHFKKFYICIDALNECAGKREQILLLICLIFLKRRFQKPTAHIMVTTRPIVNEWLGPVYQIAENMRIPRNEKDLMTVLETVEEAIAKLRTTGSLNMTIRTRALDGQRQKEVVFDS